MGVMVRINYESVETLYFPDGTNTYLEDYLPVNPGRDADLAVDTFRVTLTGGNAVAKALGVALQNTLEKTWLYFEERVGKPVYLAVSMDDGSTWRRSLVRRGSVAATDGLLGYQQADGTRTVVVTIERDGWWEEESETAVTLSSSRVYSVDDGVADGGYYRHNSVTVSGYDIDGDEPSPALLKVTALEATSLMDIFAAASITQSVPNYQYIEGEAMTGATSVADAARSAGYTGRVSSISAASWSTVYKTYTASNMFQTGPRRFFAAIAPQTLQGYYLRAFWSAGGIYHYGPVVFKNWAAGVSAGQYQLVDLGQISMQSQDYNYAPAVTMGMLVRAATTTGQIDLDFMACPIAEQVVSGLGLAGASLTNNANDVARFSRWGSVEWGRSLEQIRAQRAGGGGIMLRRYQDMTISIVTRGNLNNTTGEEHAIKKFTLEISYNKRWRSLL